jgi:hypothetical protein
MMMKEEEQEDNRTAGTPDLQRGPPDIHPLHPPRAIPTSHNPKSIINNSPSCLLALWSSRIDLTTTSIGNTRRSAKAQSNRSNMLAVQRLSSLTGP